MNPLPPSVTGPFISRRQLLQTAGFGFGSWALKHLLQDSACIAQDNTQSPLTPKSPHHPPKCKSVIFIFAYGGPSQVDLFDYKPALAKWHGKSIPVFDKKDAFNKTTKDTAMMSPYQFSQHGESGLYFSELIPEIASCADDICLLNSLHCESNNHAPALFQMNTGFILAGRPSMGSWISYGLGSENASLPSFVVMWDHRGGPIGGAQNWTAGFLPAAYQGTPLRSVGQPIIDLQPSTPLLPGQQELRLQMLRRLNNKFSEQNPGEADLAARIDSYELAYRMQFAAPDVVDLSQESQETMDLYGMNQPVSSYFGKQCLLARRMVEQGVRFVQIYSGGADQQLSWDAHSGLRANLEQHCPEVDKPIAGLLKDLKRRGMLEDTLVIFGGEFGRMPTNQGTIGRDHNPRGFTMMLAGGGLKGGMTYGATDEFGYAAEKSPVSINDFHATCLHLLGMNHEQLTFHHRSRDMRLTDVGGNVIRDIIA